MKMIGCDSLYPPDFKDDYLLIRDIAQGPAWHEYEVLCNPDNLSDEKLVDIMDGHAYNFGFYKYGNCYHIYTD